MREKKYVHASIKDVIYMITIRVDQITKNVHNQEVIRKYIEENGTIHTNLLGLLILITKFSGNEGIKESTHDSQGNRRLKHETQSTV